MIQRLIRTVVKLHGDEGPVALQMFAYSFLAMTAYNILRPVTRARFIDQLGADNLPYVQFAVGILSGVVMQAYVSATRRMPWRLAIPITQAIIAAILVIFWALLRTGSDWVLVAFYFFGLVLGLLLISQFWTLANEIYDARQAKRLFGFIGGGASLGGAVGAGVTAILVERIGTEELLLVSAGVLLLCALIVAAVLRRHPADPPGRHLELSGIGGHEAFRLMAQSRQVRLIALVIGLAAAGGAIIEQQLNTAAEAMTEPGASDAIAAFLAQVTFYVSIAGFIVQVALTSQIHRSLGLAFALLLLPVALGASAVAILITGTIWAAAIARVLDATLRYTVDKTTREVLFVPVPADLRFSAKPFIDVTADRFSKAAAAVLILVLIKPWGLALDWQRLSYASLVVTSVWIVTAMLARREYLQAFRESLGTRGLVPSTIRIEVADAATLEALIEELSSPDESAVLYAIDMLEGLEKRNLITPLLLYHQSPRVRTRALLALASTRAGATGGWTATVERMVHDEDVDVRAAALRALAALARDDAPRLLRRHLDDPEPRVAVAAAIVLADSDQPDDFDAAESTLQRLVTDTRDVATHGRRQAATALAHIHAPRMRPLVVTLMHDYDVQVALEAIRSARVIGMSDGLFVPSLVSLLGHRVLKSAAREALVSFGEPVIDVLEHFLRDSRENVWVRRHLPATLALMPGQRSMNALVGVLDDRDGFLRYKAIEAIETLRRRAPRLSFPRDVVEGLVLQETSRYCDCLSLRHNLLNHLRDGRRLLLIRALDDKLARTMDRIYRLLGVMYGIDDVAAARQTIERGSLRRRAEAVEYLDNLLDGMIRRRVMPILEPAPMIEHVKYANSLLKSRPRDLDDTLAQLIHDEDPVIAASACHLIGQQRRRSFVDDLNYVVTHRSDEDRAVIEAAGWALARCRQADAGDGTVESLPSADLAHRLQEIALFDFVSVDELFRIASAGREVHHYAGRELFARGLPPEQVQFLIGGSVSVSSNGGSEVVNSPAVVGFEEALQGAPMTETITALEHTVAFQITTSHFLTMVSDNVPLAQGLFRLLLTQSPNNPAAAGDPSRSATIHLNGRSAALQPVEQALLLRQHPLLARATPTQLMSLIQISHDVTMAEGSVLFDTSDRPAIYLIVAGAVILESDDGTPAGAAAGTTIGVAETLGGVAPGWRATVVRGGRAIRIDRDELFEVLADHVDLMQGLFSGVLSLRADSSRLSAGIEAAAGGPEGFAVESPTIPAVNRSRKGTS